MSYDSSTAMAIPDVANAISLMLDHCDTLYRLQHPSYIDQKYMSLCSQIYPRNVAIPPTNPVPPPAAVQPELPAPASSQDGGDTAFGCILLILLMVCLLMEWMGWKPKPKPAQQATVEEQETETETEEQQREQRLQEFRERYFRPEQKARTAERLEMKRQRRNRERQAEVLLWEVARAREQDKAARTTS